MKGEEILEYKRQREREIKIITVKESKQRHGYVY